MKTTNTITREEFLKIPEYRTETVTFCPPIQLAEKFLNLFPNSVIETEDLRIVEIDGKEIAFHGRYHIYTLLQDDEHRPHYCAILIAYNLNKPLIKGYIGSRHKACMNLNIFSPRNSFKINLQNFKSIEEIFKVWSKDQELIYNEDTQIFNYLSSIDFPLTERFNLFGYCLETILLNNKEAGIQGFLNAIKNFHIEKPENLFNYKNILTMYDFYQLLTFNYPDSTSFFDIPSKSFSNFQLVESAINYLNLQPRKTELQIFNDSKELSIFEKPIEFMETTITAENEITIIQKKKPTKKK